MGRNCYFYNKDCRPNWLVIKENMVQIVANGYAIITSLTIPRHLTSINLHHHQCHPPMNLTM